MGTVKSTTTTTRLKAPERAITIKNPFAWAICLGFKPFEYRSWKTDYRGPIAIHASTACNANTFEDECNRICDQRPAIHKAMWHPDIGHPDAEKRGRADWFYFGALVGAVELVDCLQYDGTSAGKTRLTRAAEAAGVKLLLPPNPPTPDCWCWLLRNPIHFDEVVADIKGRLNLWFLNEVEAAAVSKAVKTPLKAGRLAKGPVLVQS